MKKLKYALYHAGLNTVHVVKLRWGWFLFVVFLGAALGEYFAYFSGNTSPHGEMERLVGRLGEMTTGMFVSVMALFIAPITVIDLEQKRPLTSIWALSNKHIYDLTVESLRVLTSVLLWAIAFIIPGIFRSIQLSFFPFVVMFDEKYINGDVDCLKRSTDLIKGVLLSIFIVGFISFALDLGLKASLHVVPADLQQVARLGISALTLVLSIYTLLVSFHLYRQQTGEEGG